MIDQSNVNLLNLIGVNTQLKRKANTEGGEYQGPCPFCGGKDRFVVQPNYSNGGRWFCRVCTPRWQDAIAYFQMCHPNLTFGEVCEGIGINLPGKNFSQHSTKMPSERRALPTHPVDNRLSVPPSKDWQRNATVFYKYCADVLWSKSGQLGVEYLAGRGLVNKQVLIASHIGFNSEPYEGYWGDKKVRLPRGIVIPWIIDGEVWGVNIRNMDWSDGQKSKYIRATGSQNAIYAVDQVTLDSIVIMVETELDALVIQQSLDSRNPDVVPIAAGSISWGRHSKWVARIAICKQLLVAFDLEFKPDKIEAVEKAAAWWISRLKPQTRRLLPTKHDITDMLLAGEDIGAWIKAATPI